MKRTLVTLLAAVIGLTLLISLNAAQRRSAAAELMLTETTKAAVAEASAELEALTLSLEKLLLTTSPRQQAKLLSQIILAADRSQLSLSALPDREGQQGAVLSYLSQLAHRAQSILADLAQGDGFTQEDSTELADMRDGLLYFTADSDAIITKGIAGLLIRVFSGQKPADIAKADLHFIDEIGLTQHLSPTRSNGLLAMVKQIKFYAIAAEAASQNTK